MADDTKNPRNAGKTARQLQQEKKEAEIELAFRSEQTTIIPIALESEMKQSFIDYAMSVITDRALPDIRDGLKPVHRRILYSMFTQGFTPDKAYRKCATTVGDVLGRFHPHGDQSVYDALVRMAQNFSMRHMLVDGHGNFGSNDGDPPAAYRYTEARLARIAMEMMADINKDTVDFRLNFDEHESEPVVLPARFPNLLVNGSTGIAVGMATNIPPHNLGEVIDGVTMMLDNPDVTCDELMEVIKGPDFPTFGTILGTTGIREAYRTGRGRIVVRAEATIEPMSSTRQRIIVTDLPYMVNKQRLIERIADLVKEKRIEGISDLRDESDRNDPVRIVIELRRDANPNVVLNQLYKHTQMQDAFNANMLALVPGDDGTYQPKVFTLTDALSQYISHQKSVMTRRIHFDLERAEARRHLVEGLRIAIQAIDEVIAIIRSSRNEDMARQRLRERFGLSEKQSEHIVDMRLGRLTGLEVEKLEKEYADLCRRIDEFNRLLSDGNALTDLLKTEMATIRRRYSEDRRTRIDETVDEEITDESLIREEDVVVTMTHFGYVKRLAVDTYKMQHRGGRGVTGMQTREEDFVETLFVTSTHSTLLFFTNKGRVFRLKAYQLPVASRQAKGMAIVNLLQLDGDEKIQTLIPVRHFDQGGYLMMATKNGVVKKTSLDAYANINRSGLIAINLRDEDELVNARHTDGERDVVLVTRKGMSIRFRESGVRATGRNTQGVRGISLADDDDVIGMVPVDEGKTLLVVSEKGFGKRTEMDDYRVQTRGGKGLITYRTAEKTGLLMGVALVSEDNDIILISDTGVVIRIQASEIPVLARITRGVTLMRTRDGRVVDLAVVEHEDEDEEEVDADEEATSDSEMPTEVADTDAETSAEDSEA